MKLSELAKRLKVKAQGADQDVQFVIFTPAGLIVAMDLDANADKLIKLLNHIGDKK